MQLEFINHASFIIESDTVRLICDPWLDGRAFNDGWALLSRTRFLPEDFARISHIWFSHEHPDHFSPPNLKKIPAELRAKLTVLYQATRDRKVVEFCKQAGFGTVVELEPGRPLSLGDGVTVLCNPWRDGDSWLKVTTPEASLLNLNDCIITTEDEIARVAREAGPAEILATQFSLSAWEGNPEEFERRRAGAQFMLDKALLQTRLLSPRYVLPFASFVWFCHEENRYMNAEAVRVARVATELARAASAQPLVLYPGDRWQYGAPHDPAPAIAAYEADAKAQAEAPPVRSKTVSQVDLITAADAFRQGLQKDVSPARLRLAIAMNALRTARARNASPAKLFQAGLGLVRLRPPPAFIWVTDHLGAYRFDLDAGLRPAQRTRDTCDIELASDSLAYAFKFLWGGETLQVNGRFREAYDGGRFRLFEYLWIALDKNRGNVPTWSSIPHGLLRKARGLVSRSLGRGLTRSTAERSPAST